MISTLGTPSDPSSSRLLFVLVVLRMAKCTSKDGSENLICEKFQTHYIKASSQSNKKEKPILVGNHSKNTFPRKAFCKDTPIANPNRTPTVV